MEPLDMTVFSDFSEVAKVAEESNIGIRISPERLVELNGAIQQLLQMLEDHVKEMQGLLRQATDAYVDGDDPVDAFNDIKLEVNKLPTQNKVGEIWIV